MSAAGADRAEAECAAGAGQGVLPMRRQEFTALAAAGTGGTACLGGEKHCSHIGGSIQHAQGAQPAPVNGVVQGALVAVLLGAYMQYRQYMHRLRSTLQHGTSSTKQAICHQLTQTGRQDQAAR
jgi:hypothetical protein